MESPGGEMRCTITVDILYIIPQIEHAYVLLPVVAFIVFLIEEV